MSYPTLAKLPSTPGKTGWPWTAETPPERESMGNGRTTPRITIVTPSYNQGQFIEATIRSVLLQSYPNLEYIIMDGGSQDGTVDIIRRYEPWLTYWISEPDRGQSHAINKGLERGTGEIFTWLNSDDLLLPGALWRIAEAYRAHPDSIAWVGACHLINADGRIIKTVVPKGLERDNLANWYHGGFFYQPSCFFSARTYQAIGGIDESLQYAMDLDLWLRLAAVGDFVAVPEIVSAAIIHENAKTQAQRPQMHVETMYVQYKHGYTEQAANRLERLFNQASKQPSLKKAVYQKVGNPMRIWGSKSKQKVQYVQFTSQKINEGTSR